METLKFWVCKCHVTYCSLFRCNYYSIPLSFFRKISTNFIADTNLTYDRESLMKWADSPLAKQLPTHWSREWKKVQDENPALFNQVISPQPINLDKKQSPSQKFLRSKNDDRRSLDVNQNPADSSFRRERTIGGRKHDNNNNHPNKQLMKSKSESRWDDATEKWVQVNGSLEDANTDNKI